MRVDVNSDVDLNGLNDLFLKALNKNKDGGTVTNDLNRGLDSTIDEFYQKIDQTADLLINSTSNSKTDKLTFPMRKAFCASLGFFSGVVLICSFKYKSNLFKIFYPVLFERMLYLNLFLGIRYYLVYT